MICKILIDNHTFSLPNGQAYRMKIFCHQIHIFCLLCAMWWSWYIINPNSKFFFFADCLKNLAQAFFAVHRVQRVQISKWEFFFWIIKKPDDSAFKQLVIFFQTLTLARWANNLFLYFSQISDYATLLPEAGKNNVRQQSI